MKRRLTIGIVGAGGDGVVVLGSLLQKLAASVGYFGQMPRYYGPQIRGGASAVKLTLNAEYPSVPQDVVDLLVCFNWERYLELQYELPFGANSLIIYDNAPPEEIVLPQTCVSAGFTRISTEITGTTLAKNIVALGLLKQMLHLPEEPLKEIVSTEKEFERLRENRVALEAGKRLSAELPVLPLTLYPPQDPSPKVVLDGNIAIARAALRAGCKAFFGYPITPASEIMEAMEQQLGRENGIFIQAEDEIAAIGLAIGASLAGAKAMTATSGPGLDLMTEMIGLASAAEIPVVIVDVQRCGPATGIPSKLEQSDLNHAVYGGHGDAPRVVLASHDVESCYRLLIEAVNIAEYFQTPVILLSDQWLGQTTVATDGTFLSRHYPLIQRKKPGKDEYAKEYQRYQMTEDLISPMTSFGDEGFVYQTTGLTHNEKGVPTFSAAVHQRMHEKRWNKLVPLRHRRDLIRVLGNERASRGIITWGSSAQFVVEAINCLGFQQGIKICIPELIYPLPDEIAAFSSSLEKLLVVELNHSGQFYRYLRSQIDLPAKVEVYARAGGAPFTLKELTEPITQLIK